MNTLWTFNVLIDLLRSHMLATILLPPHAKQIAALTISTQDFQTNILGSDIILNNPETTLMTAKEG
jgi:hypothetical protein